MLCVNYKLEQNLDNLVIRASDCIVVSNCHMITGLFVIFVRKGGESPW